MRKTIRRFIIVFVLIVAAGCATTAPHKDYTAFKSADPHSILIVPVVNHSVDVNAPDSLLSTMTIPLAEKGYYVFPVNLVKRVLEDDGLSDADMVHNASTAKLCDLFGAESVLFVSIERWDARWMLLKTTVTVELTYTMKEGKTGQTIWQEKEKMVYVPQNANTGNLLGNLIVAVVTAAVTKAAPNYIPLANQANTKAFQRQAQEFPPDRITNYTRETPTEGVHGTLFPDVTHFPGMKSSKAPESFRNDRFCQAPA